ncbi:MAG: MoxR family ATPase [Tepidisphaeraceae bacterium]
MPEQLSESNTTSTLGEAGRAQADRLRTVLTRLKDQVGRVFVGQSDVVDLVLASLIAGGHVLIEGVPGLGKTLLVRTLADAVSLRFSRIQFTPDLMPADITGTTVLVEKMGGGHELQFQPGPVLANIVLADEINRATPRTQSALLEAMQEGQVSVSGRTIPVPQPFIVLATQNPVEQEGTYPLPEAQLDRFLVKLLVHYPSEHEYAVILDRTTQNAVAKAEAVCSGEEIAELRRIARDVPVSTQVKNYAVRLTMATQPDSPYAPAEVRKQVALGASPRATQALLLLGKVRALMQGRFAVSCQDLRELAKPVLRHRLVLSFSARSERVPADRLIESIIAAVPEASAAAK